MLYKSISDHPPWLKISKNVIILWESQKQSKQTIRCTFVSTWLIKGSVVYFKLVFHGHTYHGYLDLKCANCSLCYRRVCWFCCYRRCSSACCETCLKSTNSSPSIRRENFISQLVCLGASLNRDLSREYQIKGLSKSLAFTSTLQLLKLLVHCEALWIYFKRKATYCFHLVESLRKNDMCMYESGRDFS